MLLDMAEEGGIHDDVVPVSNRRETIMGVILSTGVSSVLARDSTAF